MSERAPTPIRKEGPCCFRSPDAIHLCNPPGSPWFKVKRVSKEQYKEMLDRNRAEEEDDIQSGVERNSSAKDKIDSAW